MSNDQNTKPSVSDQYKNAEPSVHIIFGDIHGCSAELVDAMERVIEYLAAFCEEMLEGPLRGDNVTVVSVGDLIHKGPDEEGVVDILMEADKDMRVVVVRGNHEMMIGKKPHALRPDQVEWLDQVSVPFFKFQTSGAEHLVVHAGIPGSMDEFPDTPEELASWSSKKRKRFEKTAFTRYVKKDTGKFIPLGQETEEDPYWAEVYDGRFGHVWHGHEPTLGSKWLYDNSTNLDGGCVHGGVLRVAVLVEHGPRGDLVIPEIPAREMYEPPKNV